MRAVKLAAASAAYILTAAFAPQAYAALLTAEYYGTIDAQGHDYTGVWGPADSSLANLPIKIVFDLDTSKGTYFFDYVNFMSTEYIYGYGPDAGPVLSSSITIGSKTVSWVPNYFNRTFAYEVDITPSNPAGQSAISQSSDWQSGNEWAQLFATVHRFDQSLPFGIDATGSGIIDTFPDESAFGLALAWHYDDPNGPKIYDWNVPYKIASYSITAVPEPITFSMFGIGAAGVAALRRRELARA
jgi:hypothetical protein